MGMEGIGARVARKEDKRFITGKGRYTDDMVVPGMKHAHFVRSPHAHAKIKSIDTSAAEKMPGVIGVLNGAQLAEDGDRKHHLRLDDPFQGRLADEHGRLAPAGPGHGALCRRRGRHRRGRHKAQARDAAEAVNVDYETLPAVTRPSRRSRTARRNSSTSARTT
jgi:carbon-monoxide dehydrogenase large subunit